VLAVVGDLAAIWAAVMATVIAMVFVGDVVMRVRVHGSRWARDTVRRTINEPRPAGEGGQPAALRTTASRAAIGKRRCESRDDRVFRLPVPVLRSVYQGHFPEDSRQRSSIPVACCTNTEAFLCRIRIRSPNAPPKPPSALSSNADYPEMHDALFAHQSELDDRGLRARAAAIGAILCALIGA
jgi:hypothetical protein